VTARPGEQVIARQLLAGVLRGPSPAEFQAQLDDPFFEPTDRLFCRVNDFLVGHVRLVKREMRFGAAVIPIATLADLVVLPEFRRQGCGGQLLAEAEREALADGAVLGMVRTNEPNFFLRRGWCVWTRHSFSVAGAREILSRLLETKLDCAPAFEQQHRHYNIRLWRQIELEALMTLYERRTRVSWGCFVRTSAYWQWLLSRHAFDRIYIALDGPDRLDLDAPAPIVGYAVMKDGRLLELMTLTEHTDAGSQLLARACSDAIEQDTHYVRLDAPVGDPLHHVLAQAGGELGYHEAVHGEVCLIKVLDVGRAIDLLGEQLIQRVRDGGIALPAELGLQIDGQKYTLELRPRLAKLKSGRSCRSYLECAATDLTQLLLGHLDVSVALAAKRLNASTRVAAELASAIFPRLPLWRPPWDELPAP
jgi:predicted acetyltransferase